MTHITRISHMYFHRDNNTIRCMYRHTPECMAVATLDNKKHRVTIQLSPTVSHSAELMANPTMPHVYRETIIQCHVSGKKKKDLKTWNSFLDVDLYEKLAGVLCVQYGNRKCHGTDAHQIGNYLLVGYQSDATDTVGYTVHLIDGTRHSDVLAGEIFAVDPAIGKIIVDVVDVDITLEVYRDAPPMSGRRGFFGAFWVPNRNHVCTHRLALAPEQMYDYNYFYGKEILVPYLEKFLLTLKEIQRNDSTPVDASATEVAPVRYDITHVN